MILLGDAKCGFLKEDGDFGCAFLCTKTICWSVRNEANLILACEFGVVVGRASSKKGERDRFADFWGF